MIPYRRVAGSGGRSGDLPIVNKVEIAKVRRAICLYLKDQRFRNFKEFQEFADVG